MDDFFDFTYTPDTSSSEGGGKDVKVEKFTLGIEDDSSENSQENGQNNADVVETDAEIVTSEDAAATVVNTVVETSSVPTELVETTDFSKALNNATNPQDAFQSQANAATAVNEAITNVSSTTEIILNTASSLQNVNKTIAGKSTLQTAKPTQTQEVVEVVQTVTEDTADEEQVQITINVAPVATADSVTVNEDVSVTINILSNDTDADGDTITISSVFNALNGTATLSGSQVVFTPTSNYNGTGSFSYTISDGNGNTDTETVSVTINSVNDAPNAVADSVTTNEDTAVTISPLSNDTDIEGHTLSLASVTNASNGTVSTSGNQVTFTPTANYNGTGSFTYTVSDGNGGTSSETVSITINSVNDAPDAVNESAITAKNTAKTINVLSNDTDVDGDSLTITSVSNPSNGSASISSNQIQYTPNNNYTGSDSFTYTISDGNGGTDTATVSMNILAAVPTFSYNSGTDTVTISYESTTDYQRFELKNTNVLERTIDPYGSQSTAHLTLSTQQSGSDVIVSFIDQNTSSTIDTLTLANKTASSFDDLRSGGTKILIKGGTNTDEFYATSYADLFDGHTGNDNVFYHLASAGVTVNLATGTHTGTQAQNDVLTSIEWLNGSDHVDTITGDNNNNTLVGRAGNDTIYGGGGSDGILGKDGDDTIYGGDGDDNTLMGDAGNDTIYGEAGNDTIQGGPGADTLRGGAGNDSLTGGTGVDTFHFATTSPGNDTIADFKHTGQTDPDKLDFSDILSGSTTGNLSSYLTVSGQNLEVHTDGNSGAGTPEFTIALTGITTGNILNVIIESDVDTTFTF